MVIGIKVLNFSASFFEDEEESKKEKKAASEVVSALMIALAVILSLALSISLFIISPVLISNVFLDGLRVNSYYPLWRGY